jgi:ribonuclease HI
MMGWMVHIDGGSRGNPGPAGAGVLVSRAGKVVFAAGYFLGRMTNNGAEYNGLLAGLNVLRCAGADSIEVYSDSELLVRQITGQYKVKSPDLRPLFEEALSLLRGFPDWRVQHIPRERNSEADKLANQAMDKRADVIVVDALGLSAAKALPAGRTTAAGGPSRETATSGSGNLLGAVKGQPGQGRAVEVVVLRGPAAGECPAGTKKGQVFTFTAVTPQVCVEACGAVVEAVLALLAAEDPDASSATMTPRCGRPGCGAVFEVRVRK